MVYTRRQVCSGERASNLSLIDSNSFAIAKQLLSPNKTNVFFLHSLLLRHVLRILPVCLLSTKNGRRKTIKRHLFFVLNKYILFIDVNISCVPTSILAHILIVYLERCSKKLTNFNKRDNKFRNFCYSSGLQSITLRAT